MWIMITTDSQVPMPIIPPVYVTDGSGNLIGGIWSTSASN